MKMHDQAFLDLSRSLLH